MEDLCPYYHDDEGAEADEKEWSSTRDEGSEDDTLADDGKGVCEDPDTEDTVDDSLI